MKRNKTCIALALAALLALAGCGGSAGGSNSAAVAPSTTSAGVTTSDSMYDYATESEGWSGAVEAPQAPAGGGEESSVYRDSGAKLIRRAELSIQTEQFDEAALLLNRLVAENGGYFESSSVYGGSYRDANARRRGEYVVRVPAERYSAFIDSAGELGYVTNRTESSEDVGEQYYDTEARLKTQRTKQERLLAMLEKAETMEDVIALESALSEVEYQIEQYSSTLNRYNSLIGYSTFTVWLEEVRQVTEEVGETASLGERMAAGLVSSARDLVQGVRDLLIWVSYNLFGLLIVAGVVCVVVLVVKKRLKGGKRPKKPSNEDGELPK